MSVFDAPERPEPPMVNPERESLEAWLEFHRHTLIVKCAGLTGEQLASRSVPPSPLSLLGLVRHMAEVERSWFRRVLDGQSREEAGLIYCTPEGEDDDFFAASPETAHDDKEIYLAEVAAARAVVAHHALDDVGLYRSGHEVDLRWIYTHMIEEYARHNGHADLLRECIDGATGE